VGGDVAADIGEGVLFVRHNEMIEMTSEVLGHIRRYITTHNTEGESVFLSHAQVPDYLPSTPTGDVLFVRHNEMIEMTSEVLGQVFTKGSESGIGKL
jgi:hypothetical protein